MRELTDFPENDQDDPTEVFTDIHFWGPPAGDLLLMKPITCHMDYSTNEQVEIHPQVEGHLMDARVQGEEREKPTSPSYPRYVSPTL